tara:strand:+ start:1129 stop:1236 length:108 start_codon:yes stop_codon:yes gene_type:complete
MPNMKQFQPIQKLIVISVIGASVTIVAPVIIESLG